MTKSFITNIRSKVRNYPLTKNTPLVPLYEAIVNSIHAIDERKRVDGPYDGHIEIEVVRKYTIFSESDDNTIDCFQITDNGIGFNDVNMQSFMEADSEHKASIGGRGVGRFAWLKAFSSVHISSTYKDSDGYMTREFDFSMDRPDIDDCLTTAMDCSESKTTVTLKGYKKEYEQEAPKKLDTIATRIIQHCLVYFLNDSCPKIFVFDQDNKICLNDIFKEQFLTDQNISEFCVCGQEFKLLHIKISNRAFSHRNQLYLCANGRLVANKELDNLIVNLSQSIFDQEGYWYLGVLTGKYLDDNVNMSRLSFDIDKQSKPLFPEEPGMDDIISTVVHHVELYLHDYLAKVEKEKKERFEQYTAEIAPQYRHLAHYVPDQIAKLKPGLTDSELDNELQEIKRKFENTTQAECKELLAKLKNGQINTEEYQEQFSNTIKKISDSNRSQLASYVVHRRIILDLFRNGLNIQDDGKFQLESYLHQLIYPMRSTSEDMPYDNHNLWLIDEKLSFFRLIASDMPFNNDIREKRADILLLDNPVVVAESSNNGYAYETIVIFELKRPMRDDYDMEHNPVTQLQDYVKKIREGKAYDSRHRPIRVTETTQFYLYAICDITSSLERVLDSLSFARTPDQLGAYGYNNRYHSYIEVLSYEKLLHDAEKRNKVLFFKLGI